jgi:transglutaminase/protease-like cytokinesis protein 3
MPFGRGLPQFSFSRRFEVTPGPIRNEPSRYSTTEGAISIVSFAKTSLRSSANKAGASSRTGTQLAACRTRFLSYLIERGNLARSGSKKYRATSRSQSGKAANNTASTAPSAMKDSKKPRDTANPQPRTRRRR